MRRLRAFGRFWFDFVVGDDPLLSVGFAVALGICALLAHSGVPAWWFLPLAAVTLLADSLRRATRRG